MRINRDSILENRVPMRNNFKFKFHISLKIKFILEINIFFFLSSKIPLPYGLLFFDKISKKLSIISQIDPKINLPSPAPRARGISSNPIVKFHSLH